jgi:hypothetical protein
MIQLRAQRALRVKGGGTTEGSYRIVSAHMLHQRPFDFVKDASLEEGSPAWRLTRSAHALLVLPCSPHPTCMLRKSGNACSDLLHTDPRACAIRPDLLHTHQKKL